MAVLKDRKRWSLILGGVFILTLIVITVWLYVLSEQMLFRDGAQNFLIVLYCGLGLIFLTGTLALLVAHDAGKKVQIYQEEESVSISGHQLTVDSEDSQPTGTGIASINRTHKIESVPEVVTVYAEDKTIRYIQRQNRKVTESIRYAKRIQGAILPNSRLINRVLPDSFILYKPKDVVSGDFPWFAQVKNETFMAAVDCTGHGVPGALLSLVGYFLLNDIVRSRRVTDTGKILDLLDEGVSTTLRPDEDLGTKDGMDISLCKINLEKRQVEYAGAHRPLYVVRKGTLEEVKGNKFPIGGGIFKNQTNFTSNTINLEKGDSIFFCSDGFCDQFGGPDGKKFGLRQLREIMTSVQGMPMKEAMQVFDNAWESWKGEQKQTDDVLLIGVRF